ncbi:MAG: excinuclease ABC subunit UvrB [Candidatus Paceibacterota bacterium]|jgi:excinuclease ABC subunit B
MSQNKFKLKSPYSPAGDQPKAIEDLNKGIKKGFKKQTLLGVTGSGKTFTMANVIEKLQKPTLVIAHNKTLAAQLAQEYKQFFPENAVHYFVSYYDYYQPEAYLPITDTYIEKDAQINKEIDRLRHASTQSLLSRNDVIIVASVSCIYGLGSPEQYKEENIQFKRGDKISRNDFLKRLINLHFERTNADLSSGQFRVIGNKIEIMPISETYIISISIENNLIDKIFKIDPVTSEILETLENVSLFPAKHFMTNKAERDMAVKVIKKELSEQLKKFEKEGKLLEAERLKRRTNYDLAMIKEMGYCSGIENYSRHLSGKKAGEPPETLLSYFPHKVNGEADFLTIIDESHVTLPQLQGMYAGDASRKKTLVEFGFRLPSAKDNRPLKFSEFEERVGQVVYTTATPSLFEREKSDQVVEQIIRPTGLIDPELEVRPVSAGGKRSFLEEERSDGKGKTLRSPYPGQVQDFIKETLKEIKNGGRVLATTLTKKMAEDLSIYLKEQNIKSEYLHSDVKTIDRIKILTSFRRGEFDCLVGVNLLREGLDLPEVSFIGILDADKEGFLRSEVSLIQTIGRAARNVLGRVILYADHITGSMERAISETNRRREIQIAYNKKHKITPKTIIKNIHDITEELEDKHDKAIKTELGLDIELFRKTLKKEKTKTKSLLSDAEWNDLIYEKIIKMKEKEMNKVVKELDFETAAILRDEILILKDKFSNKNKK